MKYLLSILLLLTLLSYSNAQVLGNLNRLKNKVENRIFDKVADKIAEEIWEKSYKPLDEALDESMRQAYRDSLGQDEVDSEGYAAFIQGMGNAVDKVPPSYTFDIITHYDVTDEDDKTFQMKMYFSKDGQYFGIENLDEKELQMIVYDFPSDIMIMYNEDKKGKKVLNAIPIMKGLFKAVTPDNDKKPIIEKTGKSKSICGYYCEEYQIDSDDYISYAFVTKDFPIGWNDSFGAIIKQLAPSLSEDYKELENSMALESTSTKKGKSKSSHSLVTKVNTSPFVLDNNAYEKASYGK